MGQIEQVEVKLLNYIFKFRRLTWREEFAITFPKGGNPQRVILAAALAEVSGLVPKNFEEALKVFDVVPNAIITRVFKIWKGSFPPSRRFTVSKLYRAPEPTLYNRVVDSDEIKEDQSHSRAIAAMEAKFGAKEIAETRALEKQILNSARQGDGFKGATAATEEGI